MTSHILSVETTGGTSGLYRPFDGLALFNLGLVSRDCARRPDGLAIRSTLNAPERIAGLCLGRLRALPCVVHAAQAASMEVS